MANRFGWWRGAFRRKRNLPTITHRGMPSPADLSGVTLWLDAADTSTITESSGEVSQWTSKVGSSNFAQAGAGLKPITNSLTKNGLNVLDFDGVDDYLLSSVNDSTYFSAANFTLFIVFRADTKDGSYRGLYGNGQCLIVDLQITDNFRVAHADAGGFDILTGGVVNASTWYIARIRHDGGNIRLAINEGAYSSVASANSNSLTGQPNIGLGNGSAFDGKIAEVICTNNLLSAQDEAGLLFYLNQKWAIF